MSRKQRTPFPLRTTEDVMEWLREKAKRSERPVNFVIDKILQRAKREEEEGLA